MIRVAFLLFLSYLLFTRVPAQVSVVQLPQKTVPEPAGVHPDIIHYCHAQPSFASLSYEEKQLFYYTNFSRQAPKLFWDSLVLPILEVFPELLGKESAAVQALFQQNQPLPFFKLNPKLNQIALAHAKDLAKRPMSVSHQSSDGRSFADRVRSVGIGICANENIAIAQPSVLLSLVLLYLDIGLKEPGHRTALLNPNLLEMGVGAAISAKGQIVLVQDMSCAQLP